MTDGLNFYAPISKSDEETRMVYGYASTEALDSQGEVVKKDALADAINDYMNYANIREMHQPSAVGKAKKAQIDNKGLYIAAKVVDDEAWNKVKEGVYSGFSIGGKVRFGDTLSTTGTTVTGGTFLFSITIDNPNSKDIDLTPYDLFIAPTETLTISGTSTTTSTMSVSINFSEDI